MEDMLDLLIKEGKAWVITQRDLYRKTGKGLSPIERKSLASYFLEDTLDLVRVNETSLIENPGFFSIFREAGKEMPIDLLAIAGITFVDTIVEVKSGQWSPDRISLLFHECVHVCQYLALGTDRFFEEYVKGWAQNGYDYYSIPLERDAYELEHLFSASSHYRFSVETEVKSRCSGRDAHSSLTPCP